MKHRKLLNIFVLVIAGLFFIEGCGKSTGDILMSAIEAEGFRGEVKKVRPEVWMLKVYSSGTDMELYFVKAKDKEKIYEYMKQEHGDVEAISVFGRYHCSHSRRLKYHKDADALFRALRKHLDS